MRMNPKTFWQSWCAVCVIVWIATWVLAIWVPLYRIEFFLTGSFSLGLGIIGVGILEETGESEST